MSHKKLKQVAESLLISRSKQLFEEVMMGCRKIISLEMQNSAVPDSQVLPNLLKEEKQEGSMKGIIPMFEKVKKIKESGREHKKYRCYHNRIKIAHAS